MSLDDSFEMDDMIDATLRYGVPLTNAEEAELDFRNDVLADAIALIDDYGSGTPDYAGAHVDNAAGGVLTVQVTDNRSAHESEIAGLLNGPQIARLDVVQASNTLTDLEEAAEDISAGVGLPGNLDGDVRFTTVDQEQNRVLVVIDESAPEVATTQAIASTELSLRGIYGTFVDVATGTGEYLAKAGQKANSCTLGFGGRWDRDDGEERWLAITAAHCADDENGEPIVGLQFWLPGQKFFGYARWGINMNKIDATPIFIKNNNSRRAPRAVVGAGGVALVQGRKAGPVGEDACAYSRMFGRASCGKIWSRKGHANLHGQGSGRIRVVEPSCRRCSGTSGEMTTNGDSGGPWYRWSKGRLMALGTTSGRVKVNVGGTIRYFYTFEHVGVIAHRYANMRNGDLTILRKKSK